MRPWTKCVPVALAVLGALAAGASAAAQDRLEPCGGGLEEYETRVEELAYAAMPAAVDFWVTVIPSFSAEWSVGISTDNDRHFVTRVTFDRSLFHSGWVQTGPNTWINDPSIAHARTKSRASRITPELYEALRSEWERSLQSPSKSDEIVLDGTGFRFAASGRCGITWSPGTETRNGKLVELVFALCRLADRSERTPSRTREGPVLDALLDLPPPRDATGAGAE